MKKTWEDFKTIFKLIIPVIILFILVLIALKPINTYDNPEDCKMPTGCNFIIPTSEERCNVWCESNTTTFTNRGDYYSGYHKDKCNNFCKPKWLTTKHQ